MANVTTTSSNEDNNHPINQGSDQLIISLVLAIITFWLFAQAVLNIVPDIQKDVGIALESLNFAISLTALFSGCFMAASGGLADRFGHVKFTYIGLVLSIVSSLCLLIAKNEAVFIIGRIIQGLSAACIMPATLAIVRAYFKGAQRQRALSFWSIGSFGGSGACSFFGGAVATYLGWQWIYIFCILCALLAMYLLRNLPETKISHNGDKAVAPFDYTGLIFFIIALLSLNLVITKGATFGWISTTTMTLLVTFVVALTIFFLIETKKRDTAFIDFSLFKNMPYSGAVLSNFLINSVAGAILVANTYNQLGRGFSAFESGLLSLGYLAMVLTMIRVGEKILQRAGAKKPMLLGTLITGMGIALMSLTFFSGSLYIICIFAGFMLFGLGLGFYATPATDTALSHAPIDKAGIASGIFKMASTLGNAFGMAITGSVFTLLYKTADYSIAFSASIALWICVIFCLFSFISILLFIPNRTGAIHTSL